jgi:chromosome partitioning protein
MTRILAITNQKGGVGKTTTTLNLGYELARRGRRVLLVDLDPQGGLTVFMGYDPYNLERSTYSLLMHKDVRLSRALRTVNSDLALVPASIDLAVATVKIVQEQRPLDQLRNVLRRSRVGFDDVLIDTPPTLDVMTAISLVAADEVIIPAQCHFLAMLGIRAIKDSIQRVRTGMRNPDLRLRGVLPTMFDNASGQAQTALNEMRAVLDGEMFETVIPYDVRVHDAPYRGRPVVEDAPDSPAARAYKQLADELLDDKA